MDKGWQSYGLLILRLGIGAGLALHGWRTLSGSMSSFIEGVGALGFPHPALFAYAAKLSELLGGTCLVLGLFVRPAAAGIVVTMGVAVFLRHARDPLMAAGGSSKELALLYLTGALALLLTGPGPLALQRFVGRR